MNNLIKIKNYLKTKNYLKIKSNNFIFLANCNLLTSNSKQELYIDLKQKNINPFQIKLNLFKLYFSLNELSIIKGSILFLITKPLMLKKNLIFFQKISNFFILGFFYKNLFFNTFYIKSRQFYINLFFK